MSKPCIKVVEEVPHGLAFTCKISLDRLGTFLDAAKRLCCPIPRGNRNIPRAASNLFRESAGTGSNVMTGIPVSGEPPCRKAVCPGSAFVPHLLECCGQLPVIENEAGQILHDPKSFSQPVAVGINDAWNAHASIQYHDAFPLLHPRVSELRVFRTIRTGSPRRSTLVAAIFQSTQRRPAALEELDEATGGAITTAMKAPGFSGQSGTISASGSVLVVGLGDKSSATLESIRSAGAHVRAELERRGDAAAAIEVDLTVPASVGSAEEIGQAFAEGVGLSNWAYTSHRGAADDSTSDAGRLVLTSGCSDVRGGLRRGLMLSEAVNAARELAATPPNICHPGWVASQARKLARSTGLHCRVIGVAEARKLGMGGLLTVGHGSAQKPCLVILEHRPSKPRSDERLVLVGKTITYDTGGYSLKTGNGMKGMKYDMCGGAAVFGAMQAIAALKLPVRVFGVLPCAENMVSDAAYRPDDIITMSNGVTVEVTNTDAEGRLVLADALAYSCAKLKPTRIVDLATLTGGVVVGLGHFCAGMWCNDRTLRRSIEAASNASGERVWRMPLWESHRQFMRSHHADLWNSAPSRNAHPIQGAAFLSYFVDDDVPWCHLDIAGTATTDKDTDLFATGPTGFGVRLCSELAAGLAVS